MRKPSKSQMDVLRSAVHNPKGAWVNAYAVNSRTADVLRLAGWMTLNEATNILTLTEEGLDVYNRCRR